MFKTDLVKQIAEKSQLSHAKAAEVVDSLLEMIATELSKGGKVSIMGFGTFEVGHRKARSGRNLRTGQTIHIPASNYPKFKAGTELKRKVK